jgi:hypothetical protein
MARKSRARGTSDFRKFGNIVLELSVGYSARGFGGYTLEGLSGEECTLALR